MTGYNSNRQHGNFAGTVERAFETESSNRVSETSQDARVAMPKKSPLKIVGNWVKNKTGVRPFRKWAAKGLSRWDTSGILKRAGKTSVRPTPNNASWVTVQNTPNTEIWIAIPSKLRAELNSGRYGMSEIRNIYS